MNNNRQNVVDRRRNINLDILDENLELELLDLDLPINNNIENEMAQLNIPIILVDAIPNFSGEQNTLGVFISACEKFLNICYFICL